MKLATRIAWATVVLAPIGFVAHLDGPHDYKIVQAFSDLGLLSDAIERSSHQRGRLPSETDGLESLAAGSDSVLGNVPRDPWSHPYVYRRTPEAPGFIVYSVGKDGIDDHGAGDDVTTTDKSYRCETYYDECTGSLPWWRNIALATAFLGGLGWLVFNAARRLRARRAA